MNKDLISVIVPVYNVEIYLEKCIKSITDQTYKKLEIILINDGSTDNSGQICKKWKKIDSRIIFIDKKNTGVSDTRNYGLSIATGEYITFVDSDDFLEATIYEELIKTIKKEKSGLVICGYNSIYNNKVKTHLYNYPININSLSYLESPFESDGRLWNKLFKKEIIGDLRFDSNINVTEDMLFLFQYVEKIKKISILNKPLYNYNLTNIDSVTKKHLAIDYITTIKGYYYINKILEKYSIDKRFDKQAECVCNYILYKKEIGNNFDYNEYDKIIKEYMDNKLLFKVKGIKNKTKVLLAYYFKNIYLFLKTMKKNT